MTSHLMSLADLEATTGKKYYELKEKLLGVPHTTGPKNAILYDCTEAFPALYRAGVETITEIQMKKLKAETILAQAKAEKIHLQLQAQKEELLPADEVSKAWGKQVENLRDKLLNFPQKLAIELGHLGNQNEIETITRGLVYEALEELSNATTFEESDQDTEDPSAST